MYSLYFMFHLVCGHTRRLIAYSLPLRAYKRFDSQVTVDTDAPKFDYEALARIFDELKVETNHSSPTTFSWQENEKIRYLLRTQGTQEAKKYVTELEQTNKTPTSETNVLFVDHYLTKRDFESAKAIYSQTNQEMFDRKLYLKLLDYCANNRLINEALKLINAANKTEIEMDSKVVEKTIKLSVLMGNDQVISDSWSVAEKLIKHGAALTDESYTLLIKYYFQKGEKDKVKVLFESLIHGKTRPSEEIYLLCLQYFEQQQDHDRVEALAQTLLDFSLKPVVSYKVSSFPLFMFVFVCINHKRPDILMDYKILRKERENRGGFIYLAKA